MQNQTPNSTSLNHSPSPTAQGQVPDASMPSSTSEPLSLLPPTITAVNSVRSAIRDPKPSPRHLFNTFILSHGNLQATARALNIDPWSIAEWSRHPEVEAHLNDIRRLYHFGDYCESHGARAAVMARLQQLAQSSNEFVACNACCAIVKLIRSADSRHPRPEDPPGKLHAPLPDPLHKFFHNHSRHGAVDDALRIAGSGHSSSTRPLDASSPDASMPSSELSPQPVERANERCQTRQRLEDDTQNLQAHEMGERSCVSSQLDAPCPDASVPSLRSEIREPRSEIDSPVRQPVSPLTPRPSPPTFGLSPAQIAAYPAHEKKRLISIPLPEGGYTTFDPHRPFAGFNGDPIDFRRASDEFALPVDDHTRYLLSKLIRPTPECPIDFPLPDLDDNDPFPDLSPDWFPSPAPNVALPTTLKDVADLDLTPDLALTIARSRNPWLCLPVNGKGKPDRKRINADTNSRYAFRKVARAIFDARNLARSAWEERWQRAELVRLVTLHHQGKLPHLATLLSNSEI